jgi:hypothetical protein
MNKKTAFIVVAKLLAKMVLLEVNNVTNVLHVEDDLLEVFG